MLFVVVVVVVGTVPSVYSDEGKRTVYESRRVFRTMMVCSTGVWGAMVGPVRLQHG